MTPALFVHGCHGPTIFSWYDVLVTIWLPRAVATAMSFSLPEPPTSDTQLPQRDSIPAPLFHVPSGLQLEVSHTLGPNLASMRLANGHFPTTQ